MSVAADQISSGVPAPERSFDAVGVALIAGSALVWSFGGAIARTIAVDDTWTVVFWRSLFASLFLLAFLLMRDGPRAAAAAFRSMGPPGFAVAVCFAIASISFVMAISYTTVANVILVGAGVPLVAALLGWAVFRTRVPLATWAAIAAVIGGVAVMVLGTGADRASITGTVLAVVMTVAFASATVVTRRYAGVRMMPAACSASALAAVVAGLNAGGFAVAPGDFGLLFAFGALNLGLGTVLFVTGARMLPAALTGLIGTAETVLSPFWVWLFHSEVPASRTIVGGGIVLAALIVHVGLEAKKARSRHRPGS